MLDVVSVCALEVCALIVEELVVEELGEVGVGPARVWVVVVVLLDELVVELVDSLVAEPVVVLDAVVAIELVLLVSKIVSVLVRLVVEEVAAATSAFRAGTFALGESCDPAASAGAETPMPATVIPPPVSSESAARLIQARALTRPPLPTAASARRAAPLLSPESPSGKTSTSG